MKLSSQQKSTSCVPRIFFLVLCLVGLCNPPLAYCQTVFEPPYILCNDDFHETDLGALAWCDCNPSTGVVALYAYAPFGGARAEAWQQIWFYTGRPKQLVIDVEILRIGGVDLIGVAIGDVEQNIRIDSTGYYRREFLEWQFSIISLEGAIIDVCSALIEDMPDLGVITTLRDNLQLAVDAYLFWSVRDALEQAVQDGDGEESHLIVDYYAPIASSHTLRVGLRTDVAGFIPFGNAQGAVIGVIRSITIYGITPPYTPGLTGYSSSGTVGESMSFHAFLIDPDVDDVAWRIDWGDGETSEWSDYVPSFTPVAMAHNYTAPGIYYAKTQALDCDDMVSEWTPDAWIVTIVDLPPANERPTASSPQVSPSSGSFDTPFDYSIQVSDPESDSVQVTLKTYDPSWGAWEDQGTRVVAGNGTASWDDLVPFESNDANSTAQYRFHYDDGHDNTGIWGAYAGPSLASNDGPTGWDPEVSPAIGAYNTTFDYSISLSDPGGDSVTVTLETHDPSSGSWENHGMRTVAGNGTAFWNDRSPFEEDDVGLSSQYQFNYDDGHGNAGTWGPYSGPTLSSTGSGFVHWFYESMVGYDESLPVQVRISDGAGVVSATLYYDYGDDGTIDGSVVMTPCESGRGRGGDRRGGEQGGFADGAAIPSGADVVDHRTETEAAPQYQGYSAAESRDHSRTFRRMTSDARPATPLLQALPAPLEASRSEGSAGPLVDVEGRTRDGSYYDWGRATMCRGVQPPGTDRDPITETDVFGPADYIYSWAVAYDVCADIRFKTNWIRPDGQLYWPRVSDWHTPPAGQCYTWSKSWCWYWPDHPMHEHEGLWSVEWYVEENYSGYWQYEDTVTFVSKYDLTDHTMCKGVEESSPRIPIERTSMFLSSDYAAYSWLQLDKMRGGPYAVRWEWYDPDGGLYWSRDSEFPNPADAGYDYWPSYRKWAYIYLADHAAASMPGQWHVDVAIDGEHKFAEDFTVGINHGTWCATIPPPGLKYRDAQMSFFVTATNGGGAQTDSQEQIVDVQYPPPELSLYGDWPDGVDPEDGYQNTPFTFRVHYYDREGDSPSVQSVVVDGTPYAMDGSGSDADYSLTDFGSSFGFGPHDYYFQFESPDAEVVRLPATGTWEFRVCYSAYGEIIYPLDDCTIKMEYPDENAGLAASMSIRNRYGEPSRGRGDQYAHDVLIRVDFPPALPDTDVSYARLHVYYSGYSGNTPSGRVLSAHTITGDWNETTVTWNTQPGYSPTVLCSAVVPSEPGWMTWDVTEDVRDILIDGQANYGWQVVDDEPWNLNNIPTAWFFAKEYHDPSHIPYLEFELVPGADCNGNDIFDRIDIRDGTSLDCNSNGIPDECDLEQGPSADCNENDVPDECDIAEGTSSDVNENGVPDECEDDCNNNGQPDDYDISSGTSEDCQPNSIPDECDIESGRSQDCNTNDVPDECDIEGGASNDVDGNGVPDECEPDCNSNGVPDAYDIHTGTSEDCGRNGVPDECDIAGGSETDCNENGVPDVCEWIADCNNNGVLDECDIADGTSEDCQPNGIPDECELAATVSGFESISSWAPYQPGACGVANEQGYAGAVLDGQYIYFVPGHPYGYGGSEALRFDTSGDFYDQASWAAYDPAANGVGSQPQGYVGGVFDGQFIYFAPHHNGNDMHGEVLRYDTAASFSEVSAWATYDPGANGVGDDPRGYWGAIYDGRYVYFVPYRNSDYHAEVLRYDTSGDFETTASWAAYDPGDHGVGGDGYSGAAWDDRYIYFVPAINNTEVLRYDTTGDFFSVASWSAYAPAGSLYNGAVFDGRYVYFVPHISNGEVLRYDTLGDFSEPSSWVTYDPGADGVGDDPGGYAGAVFDGQFVYFVPFSDGSSFHGEVLRYDTSGAFSSASSWSAYDPGANGLGAEVRGFYGAVFHGSYVYFAPTMMEGGSVLRCSISAPGGLDCNTNGVLDECDIIGATSEDCNGNGVPDECDIAFGASPDCNGNSVPDECEGRDCNGNCILDECDVAGGVSMDCNGNGVPDECDIAVGGLFVASYQTHSVLEYNHYSGAFETEFVASGSGGLENPSDVVFGPHGDLFVASEATDEVLIYDGFTGQFIAAFVTSGSGGLDAPAGLTFGPNGNLFVASAAESEVLEYDGVTGAFVREFVSAGSGAVDGPSALTFGPNGNLFVSSRNTHSIIEYDGTTGEPMDTPFVPAGTDGLVHPEALEFGPNGNLFVASHEAGCVMEYDGSTGAFIQIFATDNGLEEATGLTFGPDGHLFVASASTDAVLEYDDSGSFVDTFVSGGSGGLDYPVRLAFKPISHDCNANGIPDACDIADEASADENANGIPDECEAAVLYVDQSAYFGDEHGTTWEDAYWDLQDALRVAASPRTAATEIRIANGFYRPASGTSDREATFQLINGVAIYGGYPGYDAPDPDERDPNPITNGTILSGDIGVNGDPGDNTYHVITGSGTDATAVLDGFSIVGGYDTRDHPDGYGAGMYNDLGSPTISNCLFAKNYARIGGGMYNIHANPTVTHCTFSGNFADEEGGGMYNNDCSPTLTSSIFCGSLAHTGAGLYGYSSSGPTSITNCVFAGNYAQGTGGGLVNVVPGLTMTNATVYANHGWDGSGLYNSPSTDATVINSIFWANAGGPQIGGGAPAVTHSCIEGGHAGAGNIDANPQFVYAPGPGGSWNSAAIYNATSHRTTFWDTSQDWGTDRLVGKLLRPAVMHAYEPYRYLQLVVMANTYPKIEVLGDFAYLGEAGGVYGVYDLHLHASSPCTDTGTNGAPELPEFDFEGDPRVWDGNGAEEEPGVFATVDMGADEFMWGVCYVDANATGLNDGTRWADAYTDLQDALDDASNPENGITDIWVAEGTYKPDRGTGDRTDTFQLLNGVAILGGFAGGETNPNHRDPASNVTILSGDIGTVGDDADNSYHVVTGSGTNSTAILDGFTITAGNASGSDPHGEGGGMYNSGGSPTLMNCIFEDNSASAGGGVSTRDYGIPVFTNCTFHQNTAVDGGAISCTDSSPLLTQCVFAANVAVEGGGVRNDDSSPTLLNCAFMGNSADYGGGLMSTHSSNPMLTNCVFTGNTAGANGGGMHSFYGGSPLSTNCTFSGNSAVQAGGGTYYFHSGGASALRNCILWGNTAPSGSQIYWSAGTLNVTYTCVQGGWTGDGNIGADPLFVDPDGADDIIGTEDDDLRLSVGSPCVDAADNTVVPEDGADLDGDGDTSERTPLDIDGSLRFVDNPLVDDTGLPDLPDYPEVIDMGAYEFPLPGDFDKDNDVDLDDFNTFAGCMAGPDVLDPPPGCDVADFGSADLDGDSDVDLADFTRFQRAFTGGSG